MGMSFFKSSWTRFNTGKPAPTDPDPLRFNIKSVESYPGFTLAVVEYPGCTTFEAMKVLVFSGNMVARLTTVKRLDPHFSEDGLGPIARFAASPQGLALARKFCSTC